MFIDALDKVKDFFGDLRDRAEYILPSSTSDLTALALFSAIAVSLIAGLASGSIH